MNLTVEGDQIRVSGNCRITGKPHSVTVPLDGYNQWKAGALIQNALPRTSRDDREWLMSGISPEGWEKEFGGDNE